MFRGKLELIENFESLVLKKKITLDENFSFLIHKGFGIGSAFLQLLMPFTNEGPLMKF